MKDITTVGCKLPHGPVMELGIGKNHMPAADYRCAIVLGVEDVALRLIVSDARGRYAVTRVESDLVAEWFKVNEKLRYVLDGSVFIIK